MKVIMDKAKSARRASRELFGHLGHKIEQPKKGRGVKFNRKQKHRKKEYDSPVFFNIYYFSYPYYLFPILFFQRFSFFHLIPNFFFNRFYNLRIGL